MNNNPDKKDSIIHTTFGRIKSFGMTFCPVPVKTMGPTPKLKSTFPEKGITSPVIRNFPNTPNTISASPDRNTNK